MKTDHPLEQSELKYTQFFPTHCNRNSYIYEDAKRYGKEGFVDVTTSSYPFFTELEVKPSQAVRGFLEAGVPAEHITMTSDGNGSLPHFNDKGELEQLEMGEPASLFDELIDLVRKEEIPLDIALKFVTSNVAGVLKLRNKGRIRVGADADMVLLGDDDAIVHVFAMGKQVVSDGRPLVKGTYE